RERTADASRTRRRVRVQDHQDESGREKSGPEHQGGRRRSVAPGSRVLQAPGILLLLKPHHHRRLDLVETRRRGQQLISAHIMEFWGHRQRWPFRNNYSVNIARLCLFYHTLETGGNDLISAATRIPITRSACSQ